jgi:hypothetical protein
MLALFAALVLSHSPARVGVHGMVVLGSSRDAVLTHIPMFHPPHDVQLAVRARLLGVERAFSTGGYTLAPERFDLSALMEGRLRSFRGVLYEGNFEGGGKRVGEVTVEVREVLFSRVLVGKAEAKLGYFTIEAGGRTYLVHRIGAAPSFEQALVLSSLPEVPAGATIELESADEDAHRLRAGTHARARVNGHEVEIAVERELSHLVGPQFSPPGN